MKLAAALAALAIVLAGCDDLDKVMGRAVEGTPTPAAETQERRIDCDLIFPGGGTTNKT